jgi:hypothetical protein
MKTVRTNPSLVLVIALTLVSLTTAYPSAAQSNPTISKKELKVLLKTANEPVEHRKIAAYYQQQAARLRADAKTHQEMAEAYGQNPTFAAMGPKQGDPASHCQRWAQLDEEQAKEAGALAAEHENMAKEAEKK